MNSNHRVFGAENESRTFDFVGRARSFVWFTNSKSILYENSRVRLFICRSKLIGIDRRTKIRFTVIYDLTIRDI